MFKLSRVRLHNICQYDDADIPIEGGLTAVCGKNGAGKSNCIRAIAYGLTGLVDGSWGNQQKLQKDGTADPGWVEVYLTGTEDLVVRRFSTSSTKFPDRILKTVNGVVTEVAVRRKEVDKYMTGVFGIPVPLMFQIMWGRQGRLDDLLTSPPALVNTFLAAVFDTKKLDKLREKLKIQIDTIANIPADSVTLLERYKAEQAALPSMDSLTVSLESSKAALHDAEVRLDELNDIMKAGITKTSLESCISMYTDDLQASENWLSSNPETPEPSVPSIDAATVDASLASASNDLSQLQNRRNHTELTLRNLEAGLPVKKTNLQDLRDSHQSVLDRMSVRDSECRLCKGHIVDHASYDAERWKMLTGCTTREQYEEAFTGKESVLLAVISADEDSISTASQVIDALDVEISKQQELIQNLTELKAAHEAHARWSSINELRIMHTEKVKGLKEALDKYRSMTPIDDTIPQSIAELSSRVDQLKIEVETRQKALFKTEADLKYYERSIQDYEKAAQSYQINSEARRVLTTIRDIYSQGRAQARYLRSKIQQLNRRIGSYMEQTGMPFSLYLNEDTHVFEYVTNNGFTHPAAHLSGAQKSISSVVLQMAMLSVIGPQMNLFLVDEPSEALDDENKIVMSSLFQRLNNLLPSMDGVMLIVTRDSLIIESCENVINVGD